MTTEKDPDEKHLALWGAIQALTSSVAGLSSLIRWGVTLLVPLMLALLGYSYAIERGLAATRVESATVIALQQAVKDDLKSKYSRHLPVHEQLDDRIREVERRLWYKLEEKNTDR